MEEVLGDLVGVRIICYDIEQICAIVNRSDEKICENKTWMSSLLFCLP